MLAIGAALIYGLLLLAYSEFYRELGVRPSEVGLDYGRGIGGAAGITIVLAVVGVTAALVYFAVLRLRKDASSRFSKGTLGLVALSTIALVSVFAVIPFVRFADRRADQVKNGRALEPVRLFGIEVLAVRADPATLHAMGASDTQARRLRQIRSHSLFYLGSSATTIILYDQTKHRVFHVPAARVVLETKNCETRLNKDDVCEKLRGK